MRNYIQYIKQDFDIWFDDGVNPPTQTGVLLHIENDADDMQTFTAGLPTSGPGTYFIAQTPPYAYFILLDKDLMRNFINNDSPGSFNLIPSVLQSPRYGINGEYRDKKAPATSWPSNDGNKNGPTYDKELGDLKEIGADFTGATTLYYAGMAIATLAAKLRAAGRLRDAGIAQYAYDRIIDNTFSITQALQYLDDNNVP
jgi:hypothetical protein